MARPLICPDDLVSGQPFRPACFETIYRQQFSGTWRLLRRLGVAEAHLDDATQDVFLVVHRKLHDFDPSSGYKSWIFAIAVRVASDYRKRWKRRQTEQLNARIPDGSPGPARLSEMQESVRLLHELLNLLDEKRRTVFVLSELEQLSVPEIAEILKVNLNTVYSQLRSARQRFDAALTRRLAATRRENPR